MPLNLEEFTSGIAAMGGVFSPSRFAVEIPLPSAIQNKGHDSKTLSLLCDSAQLPGIQIGVDDNYKPFGYGQVQKMPWGVVFTDTQMSFYAVNNGSVQRLFIEWLNSVVDFTGDDKNRFFANYASSYCTTIKISTFDPKNNTIASYTLYDAYPLSMYDGTVAWGMQDEIMRLSVRFAYTRWTVEFNKLDNSSAQAVKSAQKTTDELATGRRPVAAIRNELTSAFGKNVNVNYGQPTLSLIDNYKQAIATMVPDKLV